MEKPYGRREMSGSRRWGEAAEETALVRARDWTYVHDPMGDTDELYDSDEYRPHVRDVLGKPMFLY